MPSPEAERYAEMLLGAPPCLRVPSVAVARPNVLERDPPDPAGRSTSAARMQGIPVTLEIWPGMQHFFQVTIGFLPEAGQAVGSLGRTLRERTA